MPRRTRGYKWDNRLKKQYVSGTEITYGGTGGSITSTDTPPSNPQPGDTWFDTSTGSFYIYYDDGGSQQWVGVGGRIGATGPAGTSTSGSGGSSIGGASVTTSDTAPSNPSEGDLWYDTTDLTTYVYYNDGDSSQWVSAMPSGVSSSGGGGSSTPAIDSDSTVNESPIVLTEPVTAHSLNNNGTTSTVTMVAEDPEGYGITYGIAYKNSGNTRPAQLAADTTVDANGVYTFTPSTTFSDEGTFTARLSATDGVSITTRTVDFSLSFVHSIEYLMVGGGGGGGEEFGGGGGAGGVITSTATFPIDGTTYNIVIGDGGSGGTSSTTTGANGGNTTFLGKTALGGGGGGQYADGTSGLNGGSGGGGGSSETNTTHAGGTATQPVSTDGGFGYAGGYGYGRNGYLGGGGGGAGGPGGNAVANTSSGTGGDGIEWPTGSGNYYAGGGSGGAYTYSNGTTVGSVHTATGAGVGSGTNAGNGTNATANTGSGGGGGCYPGGNGGAGGSGIVIIHSLAQFASVTNGTETYDSGINKWVYTFTDDGSFTA